MTDAQIVAFAVYSVKFRYWPLLTALCFGSLIIRINRLRWKYHNAYRWRFLCYFERRRSSARAAQRRSVEFIIFVVVALEIYRLGRIDGQDGYAAVTDAVERNLFLPFHKFIMCDKRIFYAPKYRKSHKETREIHMDINTCIDELIEFAKNNLFLDDLDVNFARSGLLSVLGLKEYKAGKPNAERAEAATPDKILSALVNAAVSAGLATKENAPLLRARLLETVALKPSQFNDLYEELGGMGNKKADKFLADYLAASEFGKSSNPAFMETVTEEGLIVTAAGTGKDELAPVYLAIDELIYYAENNLLLDVFDVDFARREIANILGMDSYAAQIIDDEKIDMLDRPDVLVAALKSTAVEAGLIKEEDAQIAADSVMSALSLKPSEINDLFNGLNGKKATEFLYDYSVKNYYIKKTALESNIRFKSDYTKGGLELTINKARPEYADAAAAAHGNTPSGGYPQCSICAENEGFVGTGKAALRTVTLELDGEEWFWQYSPYGYLGKHGIAVSKQHTPMHVDARTVRRLMDFVDRFPHFFIGCNAALPGAGGSVLSHDHYQGGEETLPMHKANGAVGLVYPKYPLAEVEVLDWYDSVIRVTSQSRQVLTEIEEDIRKGWESYTNRSLGIVAKDENGQHNAVSLTVRKLGNGRYCLDIILRSNITSKEYPDGVFHTHPEFQALKKEANGLLEAQGLFILPGRLEYQMSVLNDCLVNKTELPDELKDFKQMYKEIIKENGKEMTKVEASIYIKAEFGSVCERILENIAVFKTPEETADFLTQLGSFERR